MSKSTLRRSVFALLFLASAIMLFGQATGSISGTVTDASGAAIPDAAVQIKNVGTGLARTVQSDEQGRYRVPELGIGDYEISATKMGFSTAVRTGINLTVGAQPVVDIQLAVGQQTQTVTVEGQVSQVETQSTAVGVLVESKQIRDLPLNGRNFTQLIALNPGVTQIPQGAPGAGSTFYGNGQKYSIAGSRPSGQNYLMDGTDMTNFWNNGPGAGGLGTALGVEAIAEFQTLTNTYSAQFGGNGAVINASSKSGTNQFHGSAYEFLRNNVLETRNVFDLNRPAYHQNQFGGSLGGPIKKDKAFFFFNYESLRYSKVTTNSIVVPDDNTRNFLLPDSSGNLQPVPENPNPVTAQAIRNVLALYPRATSLIRTTSGLLTGTGTALANSPAIGTQHYYIGRLDYTISEKSTLFVRYVFDWANRDFANNLAYWPELDRTRSHYLTLEERQIISPRLVNLVRASFTRPTEDAYTYGSPVVSNGVPAPGTVATAGTHPLQFYPGSGRQDGTVNPGNSVLTVGATATLPFYLIQNKFGFGDDIIWTSGSHNIKAGGNAIRLRENTWAPFQVGGVWTFGGLNNFLRGTPQTLGGQVSDQQNPTADATRDYRYWAAAFYVDDQWKVNSRLTLNLGLRYSPTTRIGQTRHLMYNLVNAPYGAWELTDTATAENPSLKNWDPRIGLAWDPFSDHKTSIRASFGFFHNVLFSRDTNHWLSPPFRTATQSNTSSPAALFPFMFTNVAPVTGVVIPRDGTLSCTNCNYYGVHTTPYQMQWNFNIQREIMPSTVLTIGYVGSTNRNMFLQRDFNSPVPFVDPVTGLQTFGRLNTAGTAVVANARFNPEYVSLQMADNQAWSRYHALQTSVSRRFSNGWQTQVSYTWSKSIDNGSGTYGLDGGGATTNPLDANFDKGLSNFHRKHNFRVSGVYALPFKTSGAINSLIEGWQVTWVYTYLSGSPFTPTSGSGRVHNSTGSGTGRPVYVSGCQVYPENQTNNQWFNPNCYALQPAGTYGNAGRDSLIGPNLWNLDTSLIKDTRIPKIAEQFMVQFRAEFFNVFNHPSFQNPNSTIFANATGARNGQAGQINATNSQPRQIQLALKIIF